MFTEALAGGIAASAFDTDAENAESILASLAPGLDPGSLRSRIRSCREGGFPDAIHRPAPENRVDQLRALLRIRNLDGYLIPLTDEYQGEFLPLSARRLEWLTGFGGSAGLVIVLAQKAAIFVDGRYTLQVREQVNPRIFDFMQLSDAQPGQWLRDHTSEGAGIGYDPWLHTRSGLRSLEKACRGSGISLVALDSNPVDELWRERPPVPLGPVTPQGLHRAGVSVDDKRRHIAGIVDDAGCAAALLSAPDSVAWLLNVRGSDVPNTPLPLSRALVERDGRVTWFIDGRKVGEIVGDQLGDGVSLREPDELFACIAALGAGNTAILVDPDKTPERLYSALEAAGAQILDGDDPCALPKATKNDVEIAGARNCHIRDGAAMCEFLAWLSQVGPGGSVTEISAAARLFEYRKSDSAFRGTSFDTISGAGPNGAIVHYRVTEETSRCLQPGDIYLVDSGGQYPDGTTDVTRTVHIGGEDAPSDEVKDRFTRVLKGHISVATARFPVGTRGGQLDVLARLALWEAGLDYDHGTGHGVGSYLGVHEGPQRISKSADRVALRPGMIVSNEPGYYKPGAYGIRTENLVIVQASDHTEDTERPMLCFETITLVPIDLTLIDASLLSPAEKTWLNGYHARVREEISPRISAEARTWLEAATREI